MNEKKENKAESRLQCVFAGMKGSDQETREVNITPELKEKIVAAFLALEDLLIEAFPNSRLVAQVLTFLEIAAMYVTRLF